VFRAGEPVDRKRKPLWRDSVVGDLQAQGIADDYLMVNSDLTAEQHLQSTGLYDDQKGVL
jgi:hypothetical protein